MPRRRRLRRTEVASIRVPLPEGGAKVGDAGERP